MHILAQKKKKFGWIWRQYFGEKEGVKSGLKFGANCLCYYWDQQK